MKTGSFVVLFYAFASSLTAFASTTDRASLLKQPIANRQRNLMEYGDFDRLNQLLETLSINIEDDMTVTERIGFIDLNLMVDSLTCRDISIGDIAISHSSETSTNTIDVDVTLNEIGVICEIEYDYDYGLLEGTAKAEVVTDGNAAATSIKFVTYDDFSVTSSVPTCTINFEISDVNFIDPDFASSVLELFVDPLRDLIEKEVETYACSQLKTTGVTFLNEDLFMKVDEALIDFATSGDTTATDDTSLESNSDYDLSKALNFREIAETQIGDLFETALSQLDQLFGSKDDNGDELGINNILRSYLLDGNGAFVLNMAALLGKDASTFEMHDKLTRTRISLEEVRVYGLDRLTKFDPLVVVGDHTLRNEFSWKSLNMEIDAALDIQSSSLENAVLKQNADSEQEAIVEQVTIRIGAENIDVLASLFTLIDTEALSGFTIGSVLSLTNTEDYSWLIPCLMSAIQDLKFVELSILPQQINVPRLEGFIDDGLDRILSNLAEITFEMYHDFLVDEILPIMMQSTVKAFANDLIRKMLENSNNKFDACPEVEDVTTGDDESFVDFREFFGTPNTISEGFEDIFGSPIAMEKASEYGKLPSMFWNLMDKELLQDNPKTGMPKINEVVIDRLTRGQSGTEGTLVFIGYGEDIFNVVQKINVGGFDANIRLSASDVKIENLDTVVSPLVLLEPVPIEPYHLQNELTVGVEDRPMKLAGTFGFSMIDNVEGVEISNEVKISIDMYRINVLATMMLKIVKSQLLGFPLVDAFDLNCWVSMIPVPTLNEQGVSVGDNEPNATIVDFVASVAKLYLNVSCVECSSPGVVQLSELLTSSSEAQNDVALLANTLLLQAGDFVEGDLLQVQIDRLLSDASKQCRHSPNYDPNFTIHGTSPKEERYMGFETVEIEDSTTYLMLVGVVTLSLFLLVAALIFSIRWCTRRRHSRWLSTLPIEQTEVLKTIQRNDDSLELALNSTTSSMFQSTEDIPCILRYGMPFVILGNIGLFISGHLNLGATVNIEVNIAGESIKVDQFFEFSMAKSTIDIWNAGGKELAILILVFSGIWPYTKQLITLVLWFTPTSLMPISRRGSILLWLDWMAKWSMIDIFVLIICLIAFRVSVNSPSNLTFLPEGFYSLDLLVVPLWGLYANLIAQLVSQLSSHFIIHYHRKIAKRARDSYLQSCACDSSTAREDSNKKDLLRSHQFSRPRRGEEEILIVRSGVDNALIFLVISCNACIIAGCIFPSFSIEVFGMLGVAVEAGQEFQDAESYHSVFTVIKLLFEQANFLNAAKDYVGLGSFSMIFLSTVLLVPIAQSIVLLGHWFVPMTMKRRMKMSVFIEILQAWQYAEVYVIAIFVASWQLGPISSFMVNSYCGSLDGFFSELVFYGILKNEDAQCFSIKSSIEEGFFILAVGAILLALVNAFVTKATAQYCRDHDRPNKPNRTQEQCSAIESVEEGQEVIVTENSSELLIRPPPVLFTDNFRWLLQGDSTSKKLSEDFSNDKQGTASLRNSGTQVSQDH